MDILWHADIKEDVGHNLYINNIYHNNIIKYTKDIKNNYYIHPYHDMFINKNIVILQNNNRIRLNQ